MRRKGQMTLEIVIMLLLVINVFLYVSSPIGAVSGSASRSIGTSALAVKAVDSISNKANLVSISGDGAKGYIEIDIRQEFGNFQCIGDEIRLDFMAADTTTLYDTNTLGILSLVEDKPFTYNKTTEANINCDPTQDALVDLQLDEDYRACVWFENDNGQITIFAEDVSDSQIC